MGPDKVAIKSLHQLPLRVEDPVQDGLQPGLDFLHRTEVSQNGLGVLDVFGAEVQRRVTVLARDFRQGGHFIHQALAKGDEFPGDKRRAGRQLDVEWEVRRKDGSTFLARMIAKAIDPGNAGQGTVWIVEDITERRESRKRIKRALAEQELGALLMRGQDADTP